MEKTEVWPGKVFRSAASRWCRDYEAPFNTVLGIPGAVFLFLWGIRIGFLAPSLRGLSRDQRDWGSVLQYERHSLRLPFRAATSLKEGGKGLCIL